MVRFTRLGAKRQFEPKRALLWVMLLAGIGIACWPLSEAAYSEWKQRELRASFEKEWQRETATAQVNAPQVNATQSNAPQSDALDLFGANAAERNALARRQERPDVTLNNVKPNNGKLALRPALSSPSARWLPTRLTIPKIGVDAIVVRGVSDSALKRGPGHDPFTALPGQTGNCVIAAHRNAYGWWFYRLNKLGNGDAVYLQTPEATYTYRVAYGDVVKATDTHLLASPRSPDAAPRLTLYSCTLPKSSRRVIVFANLVEPHVRPVSTP